METAKVFTNGRSQAVRLPKKFRFSEPEIIVQRVGKAVMLIPKKDAWQVVLDGLDGFTEDFFDGGRNQGAQTEREAL